MTKKGYSLAKRAVSGALIVLVFLFLDLATKLIADFYQVDYPKGEYFLGLIKLRYIRNSGIAFGMLDDDPQAMLIITAVTAVLIVAIAFAYFFAFPRSRAAQAAIAIIEAGAIGNLVDRLCLGYVRDFLDVSPTGFGVCNVADFCITFGAVSLVFILLFIGPSAVFPLTQKWRDEARLQEEKKAQHAKK